MEMSPMRCGCPSEKTNTTRKHGPSSQDTSHPHPYHVPYQSGSLTTSHCIHARCTVSPLCVGKVVAPRSTSHANKQRPSPCPSSLPLSIAPASRGIPLAQQRPPPRQNSVPPPNHSLVRHMRCGWEKMMEPYCDNIRSVGGTLCRVDKLW